MSSCNAGERFYRVEHGTVRRWGQGRLRKIHYLRLDSDIYVHILPSMRTQHFTDADERQTEALSQVTVDAVKSASDIVHEFGLSK
jgi:hypothetical protein